MSLYCVIFVVGMSKAVCIVQGLPHLVETFPKKWRNFAATCGGIVDKVFMLICTIYLKYYGTNWLHVMGVAIISMLSATALSFFLLDSPQFHYDKRNYKKAKEIFLAIAIWNKVSVDPLFDF